MRGMESKIANRAHFMPISWPAQKGEDVDKATSQIRGALLFLKGPPNHIPVDINDMLIEVFQTSSVDKFN